MKWSSRDPNNLQQQKRIMWIGVVVAFLMIIVVWVATRQWTTELNNPTPTVNLEEYSHPLEEIKETIETGLEAVSQNPSDLDNK